MLSSPSEREMSMSRNTTEFGEMEWVNLIAGLNSPTKVMNFSRSDQESEVHPKQSSMKRYKAAVLGLCTR